jgi:hypothetical protein
LHHQERSGGASTDQNDRETSREIHTTTASSWITGWKQISQHRERHVLPNLVRIPEYYEFVRLVKKPGEINATSFYCFLCDMEKYIVLVIAIN